MKKNKPRRLWLNVKAKIPTGVSREDFIRTLMRSIDRTDYTLPSGWKVLLEWRNKESASMRSGPWTEEMLDSSISSEGWDRAVMAWLKGKLKYEKA